MPIRNNKSHRTTPANERRTEALINEYLGKKALSETWDQAPVDLRVAHHAYLLKLHARVRVRKCYLLNRGDPSINV